VPIRQGENRNNRAVKIATSASSNLAYRVALGAPQHQGGDENSRRCICSPEEEQGVRFFEYLVFLIRRERGG